MDRLHQLYAFLKYKLKAQDAHGLHSPFVFDLYDNHIGLSKHYYAFEPIEVLRSRLLASQAELTVQDMGAGSRTMPERRRKIADIALHSACSPKKGELLFKLAETLRCRNIYELGTSLGLGTAYLAASSPDIRLISFEGCPSLCSLAQEHIQELGYAERVEIVCGPLEQTLPRELLRTAPSGLDMVYMDANHRYQPTVNYFEMLLPHCHEGTLIVLDDIYWSREMADAWAYVKAHPQVTLSIDLFELGLAFFRKKQPKQHFTLKF